MCKNELSIEKVSKLGRKIGRDDLDASKPLLGEVSSGHSQTWSVYENYDVVTEEDGWSYVIGSGRARRYRPLVDTPYLFRDFAQLGAQKSASREALERWVHRYGLLGRHYDDPEYYASLPRSGIVTPPMKYAPEGGPAETAVEFWLEAWEANSLLNLYEGALSRDKDKLEQLLEIKDPEKKKLIVDLYRPKRGRSKGGAWTEVLMERPQWIDILVHKSLERIWHVVEDRISVLAYPAVDLQITAVHNMLTPEKVTPTWGFRNLLGAMYLQFTWLVALRGDLSRCEYCKRIISHTPSLGQSEGKARKPREDKIYCNKQCQQNYHYHERVKPKRQSEKS
jgi:hypothetical protein